jgi:hypothetical protein
VHRSARRDAYALAHFLPIPLQSHRPRNGHFLQCPVGVGSYSVRSKARICAAVLAWVAVGHKDPAFKAFKAFMVRAVWHLKLKGGYALCRHPTSQSSPVSKS